MNESHCANSSQSAKKYRQLLNALPANAHRNHKDRDKYQ
jgi:hypothetical protein